AVSTHLCLHELALPLIPEGRLVGSWHPSDVERRCGWELYVELASRAVSADLDLDEASVREVFESMTDLADVTRDVMPRAGPTISQASGDLSLGLIALTLLTHVLQP